MNRAFRLILPVISLLGCQKTAVHSVGYGGSDGLVSRLEAARRIVISRLAAIKESPGADLCKPTDCEQKPFSCQIARGLESDAVKRDYVVNYLRDPVILAKYIQRAAVAAISIEEEPLEKPARLAVDALTPLKTEGPFTIRFQRERMSAKTDEEMEFTWGHEVGHTVIAMHDSERLGPMSVQDLLDGASACINLGVAEGPPPAEPSPDTNDETPPAQTECYEPVENSTVHRLHAGNADAWVHAGGMSGLTQIGLPARQIFSDLKQFQDGDRLRLTQASGVTYFESETEYQCDGSEPSNNGLWLLQFKRADGSLYRLSTDSDYEFYKSVFSHLITILELPLKLWSDGGSIPEGAVSAWVGFRDRLGHYFDNEGIDPSRPIGAGCSFSFVIERPTPCP